MIVGRFAPSPTGPLHYGSLVAALGSWLFARSAGGKWLLRMDDLDTQRVVPGMADDIMRTLELLGFEWDGVPVWQSRRTDAYAAALQFLEKNGTVYPCSCSRAEIAGIATAPHGADELVYPGTCRAGIQAGKVARSLRVRVSGEELSFDDGIMGSFSQQLTESCGDFVIRRADGLFAYHLATVVDDAAAGVTQVVRGSDLITSTPRQIYLQQLLGLTPPAYFHLPLVTGPSGAKLSKRDCAVSVNSGRDLQHEGGALLLEALVFLGQDVSSLDPDSSSCEILDNAVKIFNSTLIPAVAAPFDRKTQLTRRRNDATKGF
jgi:glutamyl-Q tRNA(Asp) synthetase